MRPPDPLDFRGALPVPLVEEEWAVAESGVSPGRALRIAACELASDARVLALQAGLGPALAGPLRCLDAALPFEDGVWPRVVLQHVLEQPGRTRALLAESIRVLAPGGDLLVFGFDPFAPAVLCRWIGRASWRRSVAPVPPYRLAHLVGLAGLGRVTVECLGSRLRVLPEAGQIERNRGWGCSIYLLRARKLEARILPWRRLSPRVSAPAHGLAPTAGRRAVEVA
jgi:hypothetical protein